VVVCKLENIPLYEVSVSRKRPRKEARLQVTLEGGYSSRVSDKIWKRIPGTCPNNRKGAVADCHSTGWRNHQRRRGCCTQPPSRVAVSHTIDSWGVVPKLGLMRGMQPSPKVTRSY